MAVIGQVEQDTQARALLAEVLDASSEGIVAMRAVRDGTGSVVDFEWVVANRAACDLLGRARSDLLGRRMLDPLDAGDRERLLDHAARLVATGEPIDFDRVIELDDRRVLSISARQWGDGIMATFSDVTAQRRTEERLAESAVFSRGVLDAIDAHVAIVDSDGTIIAANARWSRFAASNPRQERLLRVGANYFAACEAADPAHRHTADAISAGVRGVVSGELPSFVHEFPREIDGTPGWYQIRCTPMSGALAGSVVIARVDVTDHKQTQEQLAHARKMEAIGQLAAGIAHEINTPAQFTCDNLRFLREAFDEILELLVAGGGGPGTETEEFHELLAEIPCAIVQSESGMHRVTEIVRAMKHFSHPDASERIAVDLNEGVRSTVIVARNEWKYHAEVVLELAPDLPPIECVPGEINQVILNLVVNGAHAIRDRAEPRPPGRITVHTRTEDQMVVLEVADTGTGIPPEIQPRIFDPFFTTKAPGEGTGQGLAIAYQVVRDHGGTIGFHTTTGRGTTFEVRLPMSQGAGNVDELELFAEL